MTNIACAQQWWCRMCQTWHGNLNSTNSFQLPSQFEPTPYPEIDSALAELKITENDILYDLGCGDGRVLIAAYRQYGCSGVGIEINPQIAENARIAVRQAGLSSKIRIVTGDATKYNLDNATVIFIHLYPETVARLIPKLHNKRVASYSHNLPGLPTRKVGPVFIYNNEGDESWAVF